MRSKANGRLYAMKMIHKKKIMMSQENEGGKISAEELAFRNMYRVK